MQNEGSVSTFLTRSLQPVFPGRSGNVHTEGDADLLSFPYANET